MTQRAAPHHIRHPAFDKDEGKFGQSYTLEDEERLGEQMPSGSVAPEASQLPDDSADAGRRASFDPRTGAVRGSGASAGGGHGEDPDAPRVGE